MGETEQSALEGLAHSVLENLPEGCQVIGRDYRYLYVNDAAATHGRRTRRDLLGRTMMEAYPGIERTPLFEVLGQCMVDRTPRSVENEFTFPDGSKGWFELQLKPVPQGVAILSTDITERKYSEATLDRAKKTEANLVKFTQDLERLALVVQDLSRARDVDAIVAIVRQAARTLAGSDGAAFVLRNGDLCHYVDEDAIAPLWKGKRFPLSTCISGWAMIHRQPVVIEDIYADERIPYDAYRPTFVKSLVIVPIRRQAPLGAIGCYWAHTHHATPEEVRLLGALADSTSVAMENVRVLAELEEGKARIRAIYDHLPNATFVWKRQGDGFVLTDSNEAARRVTSRGVSDFIGRPSGELDRSLPYLDEDLASCFEQHTQVRREVECTLPGSKERRRVVLTYGFVPPDMVILHAEDVSEQRRTEEHLQLAQRLEAVGRLAGGVAHDFNNLLGVIIGYAGFVRSSLHEADPARADVAEIERAARRAASLTGQLLAFSRKQVLKPEVLDLNRIVTQIEGMLRRLVGEDIEIVTRLDEDLGSVKADPGQLEQVIMNLAVNARDAMPKGGKFTIETENVDLAHEYADEHLTIPAGRFIMLSASDTGCGMDPETREHIFEPFFTTKEKGKGTGLGLSTVYGIVKQSGGSTSVHSEVGRGTVFRIYLPRVDAPATATRRSLTAIVATGHETVLLVEDEEMVRGLAERILREAGYHVLSASSGIEALSLFEKSGGAVDLLLTDVIMPGMSGRDLAEKVTMESPGVRVLYMSGYTDEAIVHHGVLDPGARFIGKPFSAADLARKVRETLDQEE